MAALIIDWTEALTSPPYKALVLIPQDYDHLTLLSGSAPNGEWELDTMAFWADLKALEEAETGIAFSDLQAHNPPYTIAGTEYADAVALLCEVAFFNSVGGEPWTVLLEGSNNDIFDVVGGVYVPSKGTGDVNLVPSNSAGLIRTDTSGLTAAEIEMLSDMWTRLYGGRLYVNPDTNKEEISTAGGAPYSDADVFSDDGTTAYDGTQGVARRDDHVKP